MVSPTAVGGIGVGAAGVGSLVSAFGGYEQGKSQAGMYGYQAGLARLNSQIALQNADYARMQGEQQSVQYGRKAAQQFGQIRASEGASGLDVNTGSSKDVQQSQQQTTRMDLTQIRSNAAKTAYDFTVQASEDTAQAGLYDKAAAQSRRAGDISALTSIVGGATSVSSKWLAGKQQGLWGNSGGGPYVSDLAIS